MSILMGGGVNILVAGDIRTLYGMFLSWTLDCFMDFLPSLMTLFLVNRVEHQKLKHTATEWWLIG